MRSRYAVPGAVVGMLCVSLFVGVVTAREWIAELDQPCDGVPVCGFRFEVGPPGGAPPLAVLDVDAEGCGHHRLDISELRDLLGARAQDEFLQLRVWAVSCEGELSAGRAPPGMPGSAGFDWVYLDGAGRCGEDGTGSGVRGDANQSGELDMSDAICLVQHLFSGTPIPCGDPDFNEDGELDLSDPISLLGELFL